MVTGGKRSVARVRDVNRQVLITAGGVAGSGGAATVKAKLRRTNNEIRKFCASTRFRANGTAYRYLRQHQG